MRTTTNLLSAALSVAVATALPAHELYDLAAGLGAAAAPAADEPSLADVRAAAERFMDVEVALAQGYVRDPGDSCETTEVMELPPSLARWASTTSGPTCSASPRRRTRGSTGAGRTPTSSRPRC